MAVFKCKMCGGDLNVTEDIKIIECDYCGTSQTVATADSEKKVTLFNRANRLRMMNDFDKSAVLYESIIADFPEEAEAYWGLCLCKYGIEYVDDPATAKKIPTCHRSSFESIMDDSDFEQVMEYADAFTRKVYRDEAKQIEEIRRGIIEVSSNEEPYDIFICYKETDESGDRTLDSVIAQDVYDELTDKGYRVFFSRITFEDKLGVEYEPYIFAALNSAKIMLVFGTDYEYFNAVWVKNEWSRYLKLMANDKTKHLIPCYKGVDAYDMPKEFAKLQAQDMGKVGATQDLMRGIEKLLPKSNNPVATVQTVVASANPSVDSYLKRVFIFLADGDFKSADEYCEKVLDIDPENAQAYLGKLMAELRIKNQECLKNFDKPFGEKNNYQKVLRYGDIQLVETIKRYNADIEKRAEETRRKVLEEARRKAEENRIRLEEAKIRLAPIQERIKSATSFISAGYDHTVAVKVDGTVAAVGNNSKGQCDISDWKNIVAVSAGRFHTVGLKADGTVVAIGNNQDGQCNVNKWKNIVAVSAGKFHTVALKADGTVVATGWNTHGQCNVDDWRDIVAVSAGEAHTVGLKADGTVIVVGSNQAGQCNIENWTEIVAVSAGSIHTVGLRFDGTVIAVGSNLNGRCNVSEWEDIVSVAAGDSHTVGLKSDGTVIAVGDNDSGQCNVSSWKNVVTVSSGWHHTIGLERTGNIVAVGSNQCRQCNVEQIHLFKNIDTIEQERQEMKANAVVRQKQAEAVRLEKEKKDEEARIVRQRQSAGLCQHCGGAFKGLFTKKCTNCGKEKDY